MAFSKRSFVALPFMGFDSCDPPNHGTTQGFGLSRKIISQAPSCNRDKDQLTAAELLHFTNFMNMVNYPTKRRLFLSALKTGMQTLACWFWKGQMNIELLQRLSCRASSQNVERLWLHPLPMDSPEKSEHPMDSLRLANRFQRSHQVFHRSLCQPGCLSSPGFLWLSYLRNLATKASTSSPPSLSAFRRWLFRSPHTQLEPSEVTLKPSQMFNIEGIWKFYIFPYKSLESLVRHTGIPGRAKM